MLLSIIYVVVISFKNAVPACKMRTSTVDCIDKLKFWSNPQVIVWVQRSGWLASLLVCPPPLSVIPVYTLLQKNKLEVEQECQIPISYTYQGRSQGGAQGAFAPPFVPESCNI